MVAKASGILPQHKPMNIMTQNPRHDEDKLYRGLICLCTRLLSAYPREIYGLNCYFTNLNHISFYIEVIRQIHLTINSIKQQIR